MKTADTTPLYTYVAPSGVRVITCSPTGYSGSEGEFRTFAHYALWSYLGWYGKIIIPERFKGVHKRVKSFRRTLLSPEIQFDVWEGSPLT